MEENKVYDIVKNIPLKCGGMISSGKRISYIHGVFYLDGGMLSKDYQQDFRGLVYAEEHTGWNYLRPVIVKEAWKNGKEDK